MQKSLKWNALKVAFPYTIPIFAGFWFLALAYGIYMNVSGFSFWYPMAMSAIIYGGSLEFVAVSMLLSPFAPVQTFLCLAPQSDLLGQRRDDRRIARQSHPF